MAGIQFKLDFNERADSKPQWLSQFRLALDDLWRYPNRAELESQIAADMGLADQSILLTNGGDESIELLFKRCKLNDESLLIPEPCFSQYSHNQSIWQNRCEFVSSQGDLSIDIQALKSRIKAKQWLIITRPNNPTGEFLSPQVLTELIEAARTGGAQVFLDEAYIEFALDQAPINYAAFDNLVTLRTFSKAFGLAGARVGYLMGKPNLIERFRQLAMPFNVSNANLQLARAAWEARTEVSPYCQTINNNRERISGLLADGGINALSSGGNFLLFETNQNQKQLMARFLAKSGIQIKSQLNDLPNALRLTIPIGIGPLEEALKTILQPQLLAFDMDGVLIDTSLSYDACIKQTVKNLTGQTVSQTEIEQVRAEGGFNNDWDLSSELICRLGESIPMQTVIGTFQELYLGTAEQTGLRSRETALLEPETKSHCFESAKPSTAIVTGRPTAEATYGVEQLGIKPDLVISADDVEQQKPNPEGLIKAGQQTNSTRLWFCGDTVDDMQAGTAAGCVCIGIGATTPEAIENLYQAGADVVLPSINQLDTLL